MSEVKLPVGVRDGEFVLISEIKESERGLACGCRCPKCKEFLVAKIGEKNVHHFAHFRKECSLSSESALHMYAKEVLRCEKKLMLPKGSISYNTDFLSVEDFEYGGWEEDKTIFENVLFEFDECFVEKSFEGIRADVALRKGDKWLLVEFGVTHFIDDEKYKKLRKLNISCLQISFDLKKFSKHNFDKELIKEFIIESVEKKEWICNVRMDREIDKIIEENKKIMVIREKKFKEQQELEVRRQASKVHQNNQLINRVLEKKLRCEADTKNNIEVKSIWWEYFLNINNINNKKIPKYLNVEIEKNFVFDCPSKVWQSIILQKFIFEKKLEQSVKSTEINKWMHTQKKVRELKIDRDFRFMNEVFGDISIKGFNDVVQEYLEVLEVYGFIKIYKSSASEKGVFLTFRVYKNKIDLSEDMFLDIKEIEKITNELYNSRMEVFNTININSFEEYIQNESQESRFINKNKLNEVKISSSDFRICKVCGENTREWRVAENSKFCTCNNCKK